MGSTATCYVVDPTRSHLPAEEVLTAESEGPASPVRACGRPDSSQCVFDPFRDRGDKPPFRRMIHDGWAPYDRFEGAPHQQCLPHPMARAEKLLKSWLSLAV